MKLSEKTLTILKNFASINKSIILRPGKVLKTNNSERTLVAIAKIDDLIDGNACIYDLSRFLSIHSLHNSPEITFNENHFIISDGKKKTKYMFADVSMVTSTFDRDIKIPSEDVIVNLSWNDLDSVIKAAGVLQFSEIAFIGEGGSCYLSAINSEDPSADTFGVEIGKTKDEFRIIIKTDSLKLLKRDYVVTIFSGGISKFASEDVTYYIGIDSKSTYKKG
jgi:hypothetical protein